MKLNRALLLLLLVLCACRASHPNAPPVAAKAPDLPPDSMQLLGVHMSGTQSLERTQAATIVVRIRYDLESREAASLILQLDKFPTQETCTQPVVPTPANAPIPAATVSLPIQRGTHIAEASLAWPGSATSGALSVSATMATEKPSHRFLQQWYGTDFCMRF